LSDYGNIRRIARLACSGTNRFDKFLAIIFVTGIDIKFYRAIIFGGGNPAKKSISRGVIMARFTLPRDLYHGKGSLEALKTLQGKRAMICVGAAR